MLGKSKHTLEIDEEKEFKDIEEYLKKSSKTFKLNRISIKNLPKSISNKFVLSLNSSNEEDLERFKKLIHQPFSFLEYNGAKFSIIFHIPSKSVLDDIQQKLQIDNLIDSSLGINLSLFFSIQKKLKLRQIRRNKKILKLNRIDNKLEKHANYLKKEFEKKVKKYGNDKYCRFISMRTIDNLTKIRESQKLAKAKIDVLRNKKLYTDPQTFFKRMLKLFLGETGSDIINDLETLGYTNRSDAEIGIEYLLFLLNIIDKNKNFNLPILSIVNTENFNKAYEKVDILKVLAGHMFVHIILIDA